MSKYSVLMSLYIKEKPDYLRQSINSMLNQTVMPDEIVIVKDGPLTSELEWVLQEYGDKYLGLFNIITIEKNVGLGLALNIGLKCCRNELVARMDTDDISLPGRCEKQLNAFKENQELDLIGGNITEFIGQENNIIGKRIVPTDNNEIKEYMRKRCPLNHVTVMFKRSKVLKAGSYLDWFCNEDYYLWIRMFENGCKFKNVQDVLVNVRVGEDMYKRRGGLKYFLSEAELQRYMFTNKIIGFNTYFCNVLIRFILQVMFPSDLRGFIFKNFARD